MPRLTSLSFILLAACAGDPNDIMVTLQPDVISSLDGTVQVHALVLADQNPVGKDKAIDMAITYTDRNGMTHDIAPVSGKTDARGGFDATFQGLTWDGFGTITATSGKATGDATFSVLDRTPPKVTITAPATVHVNMNATFMVHVTDEIGISQVLFEADPNNNGGGGGGNQGGRTRLASGAQDVTYSFDVQANDTQVGQVWTFYALGEDLSGNQGAAMPVMVTIAP